MTENAAIPKIAKTTKNFTPDGEPANREHPGAPQKNTADWLLCAESLCIFTAVLLLSDIYLTPPWSMGRSCAFFCLILFLRSLSRRLGRTREAVCWGSALFFCVLFLCRKSPELVVHLLCEMSAAAVGCFLINQIQKQRYRSRICFLAILCAVIAAYVLDYRIPRLLAALLLVLGLKEMAALVHRQYGIWLLPALLLLEGALFVLPAPDTPIDWSFLSEAGQRLARAATDMGHKIDYWLASLGIGTAEESLYDSFAEINPSKNDSFSQRTRLLVTGMNHEMPLYLTERDFALLDNTKWVENEAAEPYGWQYAYYLNALYQSGISKEEAVRFSKARSVILTHKYLYSDRVFHNSRYLQSDARLLGDMTEDKGAFQFDKTKKKDYTYKLSYLDLDYANPMLENLLNSCGALTQKPLASYAALDDFSREYYHIPLESMISQTDYETYAQNPSACASQFLSADTSPRVRKLALEITADCSTDYEKCKAIETYLRTHYQYDIFTRLPRETTDSIDAFLFSSDTGYCVHYASAMVYLLRLNNIPARYSAGYYCPPSASGPGAEIRLTSQNAHAWPEAYIAGFGWIRFEPTTGYRNAQELSWYVSPQVETTPIQNSKPKIAETEETNDAEEAEEYEPKIVIDIVPILKDAAVVTTTLALTLLLAVFLRFLSDQRKGELWKIEKELKRLCFLVEQLHPKDWRNTPLLAHVDALCRHISPAVSHENVPAMPGDQTGQNLEALILQYYGIRYGNLPMAAWNKTLLADVKKNLLAQYFAGAGFFEKIKRKIWLTAAFSRP